MVEESGASDVRRRAAAWSARARLAIFSGTIPAPQTRRSISANGAADHLLVIRRCFLEQAAAQKKL